MQPSSLSGDRGRVSFWVYHLFERVCIYLSFRVSEDLICLSGSSHSLMAFALSASSLFRLRLNAHANSTRNAASFSSPNKFSFFFAAHNSNAEGLKVTEMKVNDFLYGFSERINECNTLREL